MNDIIQFSGSNITPISIFVNKAPHFSGSFHRSVFIALLQQTRKAQADFLLPAAILCWSYGDFSAKFQIAEMSNLPLQKNQMS
ncbi:MAG: hypothetical protein VB055_07260 [Oscillospiraceae bacterium]|nr:hypothetical protein [Oscillospiraceae bacterium]